jgi:hypothetical protein
MSLSSLIAELTSLTGKISAAAAAAEKPASVAYADAASANAFVEPPTKNAAPAKKEANAAPANALVEAPTKNAENAKKEANAPPVGGRRRRRTRGSKRGRRGTRR